MRIRRIFALFAGCLILLCSCSSGRDSGKQKLKEVLYGNFAAEFSYALSSEGEELAGQARLTKSGADITLEFLSPEALAGVTAQSGEDGLSDTLTFEYYGMRIPLPQGAFSKMNLLLSLFSGSTASSVTELSDAEFLPLAPSDAEKENAEEKELRVCTVPLSCGGEATIVFDRNSGYPVSFSARNESAGVRGEVTEWKTEN